VATSAEAPTESRWIRLGRSPGGRAAIRVARWLAFLATVALLAIGLRGVDWAALLAALPTRPIFYLLFLLWYLWLPASDLLAYRLVWPVPFFKSLRPFVIKRIYNREVLQYSGEVFFFGWARRALPDRSAAEVARMIRDQNIVQSVASTAIALLLGAVFVTLALPGLARELVASDARWLVGGATVLVVVLGGLAAVVRGWSSIGRKVARRLLAIHAARFVVEQALLIALWRVAAPVVPWSAWFAYAAVSLVVSRIPLITNRELVFASVGIGMASRLTLPVEPIAATMLVVAGASKLGTVLVYLWDWIRRKPLTRPAPLVATARPAPECAEAPRSMSQL